MSFADQLLKNSVRHGNYFGMVSAPQYHSPTSQNMTPNDRTQSFFTQGGTPNNPRHQMFLGANARKFSLLPPCL